MPVVRCPSSIARAILRGGSARAAALALAGAGALAGCGEPSGPPDAALVVARAASGADPARGRALLAQNQCGRCHTIPGVEAAQGRVAVTLESVGRRSYLAGRLPSDAETMARFIADPPALVPGTAMPKQGVPLDDARHMAAYLLGLR